MAIAFVQDEVGLNTDGATLAFGVTVTAGSLLVACIRLEVASHTVVGITDTLGNSWTQVKRQASADEAAELWRAASPSGGANTCTFDWSATGTAQVTIAEFSGFSAGVTAGPSNGANDTTSPQTCGEITTTVNDSLLVAMLAIDTLFTVSSRLTGWVGLTSGGNKQDCQYKITTTTETTDGAVTMAANESTAGAIGAFSETAAAAGAVRVRRHMLVGVG